MVAGLVSGVVVVALMLAGPPVSDLKGVAGLVGIVFIIGGQEWVPKRWRLFGG